MAQKRLPLSFSDVQEAMTRIRQHVHYTPMMQCSHLDSVSGFQLHFKCETFQKTGSFKIRGATNTVQKIFSSVNEGDLKPIVVTHSSGNHAQAAALAAKWSNIPAHIVMPSNSPKVKVDAVKDYGGSITFCEPNEQSRHDTAKQLLQTLGPSAVLVPPSEHPDIMAGQGTIAMEMLEQVPNLDATVGAVGSGGFVAGVCIAAKAINPNIKVFAAEPENTGDCARSLEAGKLLPMSSPPQTIADALRVKVCELAWPVLLTHLSGVVTVSEEEIVSAMRLVWEHMKLVIEPAAACAVAAVLTKQFKMLAGNGVRRVGVILCGGNVDLDHLPWMQS